jgi:hypothetical protein
MSHCLTLQNFLLQLTHLKILLRLLLLWLLQQH